MKKKTIIMFLALIMFAGCKKGDKVEPTYFSPAEFKGFTEDGKAKMHIVGPITGSPHASEAIGETLDCTVSDDLKKGMTKINSMYQTTFHYYKRAIGKDKYSGANVIEKI